MQSEEGGRAVVLYKAKDAVIDERIAIFIFPKQKMPTQSRVGMAAAKGCDDWMMLRMSE
jgi:hypothetical protein